MLQSEHISAECPENGEAAGSDLFFFRHALIKSAIEWII